MSTLKCSEKLNTALKIECDIVSRAVAHIEDEDMFDIRD
jgi:hypothetical protein